MKKTNLISLIAIAVFSLFASFDSSAQELLRDKLKGTTGNPHGDFNQATHFTVEIDGKVVGGVHQVDGLSGGSDRFWFKTVTLEDGRPRIIGNLGRRFRPGNQGVINFKITRNPKDQGDTFVEQSGKWFEATRRGKPIRTSATITFLSDNNKTVFQIHLHEIFPFGIVSKPISPNSNGVHETINFKYEMINDDRR